MITKNDIIKMAKHVARKSSGRQDRRIMHPDRDWAIGFLAAVVLLILGATHAGLTFYGAWNYNPDTYEANVTTATYRDSLIRSVLDEYRREATRHNELRGDVALVVEEEAENGTEELEATTSEAIDESTVFESVATTTEDGTQSGV